MNKHRIIVLLDMDCFYVQCEQRLQPDKWHKPCAVAQYNNWKGGGIIAVNYEARPFGVKRGMRGDDAQRLCPELHIFSVPDENGKANLDRYRDASSEVFEAITEFIDEQEKGVGKNLIVLERASVDEAFIDFTKFIDAKPLMLPDIECVNKWNNKLELNGLQLCEWLEILHDSMFPSDDNLRLLMTSILTGQLRQHILEKTQFRCSAGISHNKMLSKLACSINKPNSQTILPMEGVSALFQKIDLSDVRMLGGKLGRQIKEIFAIKTMHELNKIDKTLLAQTFDDKTANWLYDLSCGIDEEPVSDRKTTKSIGCGKNFPGKKALTNSKDILHWIKILLAELYSRITKDKESNKRLAKLMVVGYYTAEKGHSSRSVQININAGDYPKQEKMANDIMRIVFPDTKFHPILNLSIAATKFVPIVIESKIDNFFRKINKNEYLQNNTIPNDKPDCSNQIQNTIEKYFQTQSNDNEKISEEILNFNIEDEDLIENKINDDFNLLFESFFFRKIMSFIENNEFTNFND